MNLMKCVFPKLGLAQNHPKPVGPRLTITITWMIYDDLGVPHLKKHSSLPATECHLEVWGKFSFHPRTSNRTMSWVSDHRSSAWSSMACQKWTPGGRSPWFLFNKKALVLTQKSAVDTTTKQICLKFSRKDQYDQAFQHSYSCHETWPRNQRTGVRIDSLGSLALSNGKNMFEEWSHLGGQKSDDKLEAQG